MASSSMMNFMGSRDPSVIPAGVHSSSFLGSMSNPMANAIGSSSTWDIMSMRKPYNVSSYEWSQQINRELGYRATGIGTDMAFGLANLGIAGAAFKPIENRVLRGADRLSPRLGAAMRSTPGRIATGIGVYGAMSMALDPITESLSEKADEYQQDYASIRRMSTRFGPEFNLRQSRQAAKGLTNIAYNEIMQSGFNDTKLGMDGIRAVTMQGLQMNMFQGQTPEELVKQVEKATKVVKFLTGILGSKDVTETMETVGQLKSMGVNVFKDTNYVMKLGAAAYAKGTTMGVQPSQLLQTAIQTSAGVYGQFGLPSFGGVMPMMNNMSALHELEKSRFLSAGEIAAGGGHQGIARAYSGTMAQMMSNPQVGGVVLAAGMDKFGNFRQDLFNRAMKGNGMDLVNQGASSLLGGGPMAMFRYQANRTKMYEQMMKDGKGEEAMERAMGNYMDMMPFADQGGYEDKVAFYASMYKQMTGSTNDAEAKLFALKKMNPKLNNSSAEKQAMRNSAWNKHTMEHGRFSDFRRNMEDIAKIPDRVDNWTRRNIVHPVVDFISDGIGETDKAPGYATMNASEIGPYAMSNISAMMQSIPENQRKPDARTLTVDQIRGIEQEERKHGENSSKKSPFTIFSLFNPDSWRYEPNNDDTKLGASIYHEADRSYYDFMMNGNRESYAKKMSRGDYQGYTNGKDMNDFEKGYMDFADKHKGEFKSKSGLYYMLEQNKDKVQSASDEFIAKNGGKSFDSGSLSGGNYLVDKKIAQANLARGTYKDQAKQMGISQSAAMRLDLQSKYGKDFASKYDDLEMQLAGTSQEKNMIEMGAALELAKKGDEAKKAYDQSQVSIGDMNQAAKYFDDKGLDMKQLARAIGHTKDSGDVEKNLNVLADMVFDGKGKGKHEFAGSEFDFLYEKNANGELSQLRKGNESKEEFIARLKKAQMGVAENSYAKNISDIEGMNESTSRELTRSLMGGDFKAAQDILNRDKTAKGAHNDLLKEMVGKANTDLSRMSKEDLQSWLEDRLGADASQFQGKDNADTIKNAIAYATANAGDTEAGQKDQMDKEKLSTYADGNALRVRIDNSTRIPDVRALWDDAKAWVRGDSKR